MTAWHEPWEGNKHPAGRPFAYCRRCSYAIVFLAGRWWHLAAKARTPAKMPSRKQGGEPDA